MAIVLGSMTQEGPPSLNQRQKRPHLREGVVGPGRGNGAQYPEGQVTAPVSYLSGKKHAGCDF